MANTADYDAPRRPALEVEDNALEEIKASRPDAGSPSVDLDETDASPGFELPGLGLDISDDELSVAVVPMKPDEFRCPRCFLVHHRSQLADPRNGENICKECA